MPKGDVDPVLETLIRGMLDVNFDDRFTILQIKDHDWLKKKHPMDAPPVTVTPRDMNDPTMATSVIPYLVDLHFGDEKQSQQEFEVDNLMAESEQYQKSHFITEHELNEQERKRQAERQMGQENDKSREHHVHKSHKTKTTKCIKVKKMNNCAVS